MDVGVVDAGHDELTAEVTYHKIVLLCFRLYLCGLPDLCKCAIWSYYECLCPWRVTVDCVYSAIGICYIVVR